MPYLCGKQIQGKCLQVSQPLVYVYIHDNIYIRWYLRIYMAVCVISDSAVYSSILSHTLVFLDTIGQHTIEWYHCHKQYIVINNAMSVMNWYIVIVDRNVKAGGLTGRIYRE